MPTQNEFSQEIMEGEVKGSSVPSGEGDVQPLLPTVNDPSAYGSFETLPHPSARGSCSRRQKHWTSELLFSWIEGVLEKSRRGEQLHLDDTLILPSELTAATLSERLNEAWLHTVRRGRPSITTALHSLFFWKFWIAGLLRLVAEICKIASPIIIREVILHVKNASVNSQQSPWGGLPFALVLFAVVLLQACTLQHFIHRVFVVGAGINSAATALVYNKSLKLSQASLEGADLGRTLNFQAKDCSRLREVVVFSHNLWAAPLTTLGCTLLLLYILGPTCLVGVCAIPVLIPVETWVARRSEIYRKSLLKVSDVRISLIGEIVDGIKTVKLTTLGPNLQDRVNLLRSQELLSIRQALTLNACNQVAMRSSPIAVALATFTAYVISGNELTAETAFAALVLFHTIGHPFHVMPKAIRLYVDAKVSLQRLQSFLLENETKRTNMFKACHCDQDGVPAPRIVMKDATLRPVAGKACLERVTVEMGRGLSVVMGKTGCGKTTLLRNIVEHLAEDAGDGTVYIETLDNKIAYCPDTPWIVNASARDNICLGSNDDYNHELYKTCVRACALEEDFGTWPEGDDTVIGTKGITISGGQKSRVTLARAMYSSCRVVLLDDPLSSLDTVIGNWVFQHAVCEMAKDSAMVMSTHQKQYTKDACDTFVLDGGTLRTRSTEERLLEPGMVQPETIENVQGLTEDTRTCTGSASDGICSY